MSKPFDYINDVLNWSYKFCIDKYKKDLYDPDEFTLPILGLTNYEKEVLMECLVLCLNGHRPTRKGVSKANYRSIKEKYPDITEDEFIYYGWLRRIMANIFFNAFSLAISEESYFITLDEIFWGLEALTIFHFAEEEIENLKNIIKVRLRDILSYTYPDTNQK